MREKSEITNPYINEKKEMLIKEKINGTKLRASVSQFVHRFNDPTVAKKMVGNDITKASKSEKCPISAIIYIESSNKLFFWVNIYIFSF